MKNISPKELDKKIHSGENFILLDVRTEEEFEEDGKIKGAILIPLDQLQHRVDELDKDKEIVVYCRSGNRSLYASQVLEMLGFKKITNLDEGILKWEDEGFDIEY